MDDNRPTSEDTPIAKTLKPRQPAAAPTPAPEESGARKMIHNIMEKAADTTTGGASSLVEGALKHF